MKAWTQQAIIQGMRVPVPLALTTKHRTNFYCVPRPSHINKSQRIDHVSDACQQRKALPQHATTLRSPAATTQTHTFLAIWKTKRVHRITAESRMTAIIPRRWGRKFPPKYQYISTELCGDIFRKTSINSPPSESQISQSDAIFKLQASYTTLIV